MGLVALVLSSIQTDDIWKYGAVLGIVAHNFIFIRGEWHISAPTLLTLHLTLPIAGFMLQMLLRNVGVNKCAWDSFTLLAAYVASLLTSMTIYRVFFHRLRAFPGPWQARSSKLWHVWNIQDGSNHHFLESMRREYGDFVRTGPNELTVFHPDIHRLVDGPYNTCTKSEWYDVVNPHASLVSARDKNVHDDRRRLWFKGLGPKSMAEYEERMLDYVDKLVAYLDRCGTKSSSVNVSDAFFWFCWDVMGDTTFGKSFGMLDHEKWHQSIVMLKRALSILGMFSPTPWAFHIAFKYLRGYWVVKDWEAMKDTCSEIVYERIDQEDPKEDIFQSLVARAKSNGLTESDYGFLIGDAVVGLVAGSDPVAATLVFLFSHLARDPVMQEKLFDELSDKDIRDANALKSCEYLTSLVNETLRLYPPLMTGGMRNTGPNGLMVGDTFIPSGITIISPRYSISRLESCFSRPNEFIPERWTTSKELNKYGKAFDPFGIGANSCVGKNIVWSEIRLLTAAVISRFNIKLSPGETGRRAWDEFQDFIAPNPGPLSLVFEPRK